MRNIFLSLVLSLAILSPAFAAEYFDQGYRGMTEDGFYYLSSNHDHVFVCGGAFIVDTNGRNNQLKCPSSYDLAKYMVMHAGTHFKSRLETLKQLNYEK